MKLECHLIGLLTVGLVVTTVTADISLKLKNQQYLPPGSDSQKFEESKYGSAKYHQFEVHTQGGSSQGNGGNNNPNSALSSEKVRIEHINAPPGFPLDNPDFDASLLNVASEAGNSKIILKHENAPNSSPINQNIPVPFPSNYQHDFPGKTSDNFLKYEAREPIVQNQPASDALQNSQYLPPVNSQQYAQQGSEFSTDSSNNELAQYKGPGYLPPHGASAAQSRPFKASQYLPPDNVIDPFKGPDYLPPKQEGINSNNAYKAPGYLPPQQNDYNQESFQATKTFTGAGYLPPQNANGAAQQGSVQPSNQFRAPDYLPPHQQQQQQHQQQQQQQQQQHQQQQQPHQDYPINDAGFKAPGYLPPGYDFQKPSNAEEAIAELHTLPEQSNNNQNQQQYQQTQVNVQSQIQVSNVYGTPKQGNGPQAPEPESNQAGAYLPPGYDVKTNEISGQQDQNPSSPGYLPPPTQSGRQGRTYGPAGYLPPGYDFQKPLETEPTQSPNYQGSGGQQQQSFPTSQSSTTQPQNYHSQTQQQSFSKFHSSTTQPQNYHSHPQSSLQQNVQPGFKAPGYLPPTPQSLQQTTQNSFTAPGYLPPNTQSSQHSSQSFTGPGYLPPTGSLSQQTTQQSVQSFKAPGYLPPTGVPQTGVTQSFQAPGYLPPTSTTQIYNNNAYKGSNYLPPPTASGRQPISQQSNFNAPNYLPPEVPAASQASTNSQSSSVHPLSSYMTNVQPFERYGSARKPFADYGPPPTQAAPINPTTEVAPMYKEAANRPQFYAPAMSYATNAISYQEHNSQAQHQNTQSTILSQQTRETLQTFMPQEIRQGNTAYRTDGNTISTSSNVANAKVPTSTPASSKIRTVQIVNPNEVKTLKVLESLDHTGVKTIKILGPSNETPMGQHRVVKVVSGHEHTVQTVKIYNDEQDYTPAPSNNDYLPPRHKRHSKKFSGKGRQRITSH